MLKAGYAPPLILLAIAACFYMAEVNKSKKSLDKKDWSKINQCIAHSAKQLNDEAMKTYRLIDWETITPEQSEERRKLLSRLNVEKLDRDKECREKGSF